ncbi:Protein dopey [Paramyrothecium foliicola]|nr:Protein dopey [Paramyrothecium foliicola]
MEEPTRRRWAIPCRCHLESREACADFEAPEESPTKDKTYRRYAAGIERVLSLFETALEEWADYISFLNRLLKALQARPSTITTIPSRALVAKRLAQCLNPALPSGVHQKTLEVYHYVFTVIGKDGLSRDLPLYLPGLAPTLSFASLSVRSPYLDLLEQHFLAVDPRSLRPAMKSIILALLPGLEEETSEDFDRTLRLVAGFKEAIRPPGSEELTPQHSSGDDYFWQCFFLASITSHSRRSGALAYLVRYLPALEPKKPVDPSKTSDEEQDALKKQISLIVTSPEPGLLVRCFATGLGDEQLLIQRGFLDLLVTHLPLNSHVLQTRVKSGDLEILLRAAAGVVTRRDMSLNRRLWAWLLGPEPTPAEGEMASETNKDEQTYLTSKTSYFEEYGLQPLTRALLDLIKGPAHASVIERARPFRICLSLMDRWEIGGLIVPEVFLPVIESVRQFKDQASSKSEYNDVLRSASVFFDGIESGLIYGELVGLLAQAMSPGNLSVDSRLDKLSLVNFILTNFNVREEEMITIHAPLACLAALSMLEDSTGRQATENLSNELSENVLDIATSLLDLVPERAFRDSEAEKSKNTSELPNLEVLKQIKAFYVTEQGNIEASPPPFNPHEFGLLLLQKSLNFICNNDPSNLLGDWSLRVRVLSMGLLKTPAAYRLDTQRLLDFLHRQLDQQNHLPFSHFSSIVHLSTQLYATERIDVAELSALVPFLVRHAWSYLSASEPRYHVESVRCLWQLQTALSPSNRDIEAAISTILVEAGVSINGNCAAADLGRSFGVLWSHTLQDNQSDRRGSKTPLFEQKHTARLSGMDNYELMLTQPLFLVLDALVDDRTQLHMAVKSWLNSMVGIDRLLLIFVNKLSELPFLKDTAQIGSGNALPEEAILFSEEDDLDLCLYYLRTLHHILRHSGGVSWAILASKHLLISANELQISVGGEEDEMTLQEFFVRICMRCITADFPPTASKNLVERASQLYRFALTTLHQFLLSQYASPLSAFHLEDILLGRLLRSINGPDPYIQILLLDVVYDCLRLRDTPPVELPTSPGLEKKGFGSDNVHTSRQSLTLSDTRPAVASPPPQLLKCLQAGLSSPNSRPVLENWVAFFTECLPFYSDSVFQVLIPLVETLCKQVGLTFSNLRSTFAGKSRLMTEDAAIPESTLIHLLNGLEQVLARAHDQLLLEEARAQLAKGPDQPQSLFGSMVSGVFQADAPHSRSATANDRLTVHLAFQDAVRICFKIWSWGQGDEAMQQDPTSLASFGYTSLRMRNRARRLLEHLFTAETLECLETIIEAWKKAKGTTERAVVFKFLSSLDASRPRHTIPALFNAIYSRANPTALDPSRKSTMTISLTDSDLVVFLVEYARSLDDDAMDEIWQDCMTFLKDLLSNPFPHRHTLPSLLEFAAILGEKVDNTNFGEQRRMRRELGDVFLRLLTALFTARPISFTESSTSNGLSEKSSKGELNRRNTLANPGDAADDVVYILSCVVPVLSKILLEPDRVLSAANTISSNVIGPTVRSKTFPDTVTRSTMKLFHELTRLQNNQKTWKKDVGDAFNDPRFFGMNLSLVKDDWLPLLSQWILADKERMTEIVGRINAPTTAGIVFGVGATSARLEADRRTQLSLRRIATLILASAEDAFVSDLSVIFDKLVELLAATSTSSPSSTTRADVYMVVRALVLKTSAIHLAPLWPVVNAELHAAISSVTAPDNSTVSDVYTNSGVLQACKLLDLLICVAPDDFQLHEWLFITDTIDAVYRSSSSQPVALVDELSEELGNATLHQTPQVADTVAHLVASSSRRHPLLGQGGLSDEVGLDRRDELIAKVLRPFFGQLSIFAFESTYAMGGLEWDVCAQALLKDVFDERSIVKAL